LAKPSNVQETGEHVSRRQCLNVSKGARLALWSLALPVSPRGRPAFPRRFAIGSIVFFSRASGSSETEHRDRGTTRERKHRTNNTESLYVESTLQSRMLEIQQKASTWRVRYRVGCWRSKRMPGRQEENAGWARTWMATRKARQARRAWCEPSQCIRPGHSSHATSFAAKKPHKAPALCEHQRRRSRCKDCGGSGLCEHQRQNCLWCSQMLLPPQSLHALLRRWCSQMLLPPQSLHLLLCLWCSHRAGALRGFLAAEGCRSCGRARCFG